jgi:hypothetical protein
MRLTALVNCKASGRARSIEFTRHKALATVSVACSHAAHFGGNTVTSTRETKVHCQRCVCLSESSREAPLRQSGRLLGLLLAQRRVHAHERLPQLQLRRSPARNELQTMTVSFDTAAETSEIQ